MGPTLEFGDRFIRQVYMLTIILTAIIGVVLLGFKLAALPSFLIGSVLLESVYSGQLNLLYGDCCVLGNQRKQNICLVS